MTDTTTPIFLSCFWAVFLLLAYFSVFRTSSGKGSRGRNNKNISTPKAPSLQNVLIILAVSLVTRILLTSTCGPIADTASPLASWWYSLSYEQAGSFARILAKLPGILADTVSAFLVYKLVLRHLVLPKTWALSLIALCAFNPYSLFASAYYVETVSVSFALLLGAFYLLNSDFSSAPLFSGICLGLAILFHSFSVYAVVLFLISLYLSAKGKEFSVSKVILTLIPAIIVGVLGYFVVPGLSETAQSAIGSPTSNAFNFYILMDSWKQSWYNAGSLTMNSRLFFLPVPVFGRLFTGLSILLTAFLYARSGKKNYIFYYTGLLLLSVYTFATGMNPFLFLPILFFFFADFAISRSNGSLIIGLLTSVVGLLNISYHTASPGVLVNGGVSVATAGSLLLFVVLILAYYFGIREHNKEKDAPFIFRPLSLGKTKKMVKLDWLILTIFTVVALFSNFWQLGDMHAPSSVWKATEGTETVVEVTEAPSQMSYFLGLGEMGQALQIELKVETSNDGVNWTPIQSISTSGYCYTWYDVSLANVGRYLKFIAAAPHMQVLEIGLYDGERNLIPVNVVRGPVGAFDEQELAQYGKTYKNSMYFDEVYHGRTAYEVTERINEYEWTHPPLGKLIMSLGIQIFGMNPFGWRAAGALFGALLVPLMYLFGKKIFARTILASGMAFLMLFDNFRFAQTRIGTIDTYGVFFIILMYYFMYDFYTFDFKDLKSPWQMWKPLLLSGIFMGIGCAAKWIGFYAAVGLAILFFLAFYRFSKENKKLFAAYSWKTIGLCVIFFGVVPFLIYYASYLPHLSLYDYKFSEFIHQQESMLSYHSKLESTHSYSSSWYMWPFMFRPVYMCSSGSGAPVGFTSRIAGIGNPAIWWMLLPALVAFIYLACKKMKDRRFSFLIIGFLAQYLSWVLISRTTYQYHFFASLPFLFAILLYVLFWLKDNYRITPVIWGYAILVVIAFIAIFPAVSGLFLPADTTWFDSIRAFDTWNFL